MQWFRRKLSVAISTALAGKPVEPTRRPTALLMPLEPRVMFDGAIAASVEAAPVDPAQAFAGSNVVAVDAGNIGSVCGVELFEPFADSPVVAMDAGEIGTVCGVDLFEPSAVATSAPTGNAVVFVDSRVQDADSLLQNIGPGTDVVYLDGTQDGLQQIAEYLQGHPGANSLQLFAHGNDGDLWLGSTYLSSDNLNDHAVTLAAIGAGIQQGGDILIYGCETAAGEQGSSFVNSFAALTGRDVAASDDRTGAGGDWDLEISVGSIEAAPALTFAATGSYAYDLAIITVTNNANSGVGTLRNAIASASSGDTITFNAGMSIALTTGELLINQSLTIDGDLDNNGTADVTVDANYLSRVLSITAGTVSLDGLVIREGRVSGNGGGLGSLDGSGGLGGGLSITGGTVTISHSTFTNNVASGGGGGGSGVGYSYGGGGGGGFNGIGGGNGGAYNGSYGGVLGGGGVGAIGGYSFYSDQAGKGGSTAGGAGGLATDGFVAGGGGGTAGTIGGGGGGAGASAGASGGAGGAAAGGLYIGSGATVFLSSTTVSNNLGAGGGGGGGYITAGGNGGTGVGGILNAGTLNYQSSTVTFTGNIGGGGSGGESGGTRGTNGASVINFTGGIINGSFVPNVAPVVANLNGDSVFFVEELGPVRLDSGSNATVTDGDSANFSGGNVTVSIIANRMSAEDVLGVRNQGLSAGQIGTSGSNITFGGTIIGTFTGGTGTDDLVITLNASSTLAAVQALARNLTYNNSNGVDPSSASRAVRVTVNDGDGGTSTSSTISVGVISTNDAPTLSATAATVTYTENGSAVDLFSSVSISTVESGQTITQLVLQVTNLADRSNEVLIIDGTEIVLTEGNSGTTTNGVSYSVTGGGSTAGVILTSATGLSTNAAQTLVDGITYRHDGDAPDGAASRFVTLLSITDSGGIDDDGVDTGDLAIQAQIDLTAVNDAPTLSGEPYSLTDTDENTTSSGTLVSSILGSMAYADVDSGASSGIAITSTVGNGTWQYSTDDTTWTNVGAVSSSAALLLASTTQVRYIPDGIEGETATLTFHAWDQTSGSASSNGSPSTADTTSNGGSTAFSTGTAQASLTVTASNDAPTLAATGGTPTFTENDSAADLFSEVSISAIEPGQTITAFTLTVSNLADGSSEILHIDGTDIALTNENSGTTSTNWVSYTVSLSSGTATVTLSREGGLSTADAQTIVAGMGYRNDSSTPVTTSRVVTLTSITDSGGTSDGGVDTTSLSIAAIVEVVAIPTITGVASSTPDGTYGVGHSVTLLVTFDDVVTVDTSGGLPRLQLATGEIGTTAAYVGGSGTHVLTFEYVVQSGDQSNDLNYADTMSLQLNSATIRSGSGVDAVLDLPGLESRDSLAGQADIVIDGVLPTASIVVADAALAAGATSLVTITFSEAVTDLTTADLTVANGTLSTLTSSDGGVMWTATFTPDVTVTDSSNLITLDNTGVRDAAGNAGSGTTDSNNYAIDTALPTATIVVADTVLAVGETSLVTITFSEAVEGLTIADLTVANGTLGSLSSSDGGVTWTATFTPDVNVTDSSNLITLDNTGVQDAAGNAGSGSTDSNNYAVDTVWPTSTIVVADTALLVGETSLVTITFSEAVTGLTIADLTVANGTLSALSSGDGGVTWTATFMPTAAVTDTSNLITLDNTGVQDTAGNAGSGSTDSNNYAIDTARPTATIVVADAALAVGETSLVTITFSEAVTDLTTADLTVANGTLSTLSSSDGGVTWTATFTPTAAVTDSSNLITLDNTGVQDAAGNAGSGTTDSNNYAIDTARPTATIVVADTVLAVGETSLVTITFSEAVEGLTTASLTVANGTLGSLSSSDGGVTWTATFTPTAAVTDSSNLITLDNTGVQDAAGNAGSGSTDSNNYAIDTVRPTSTIVMADASLVVGATSLVTITFSEAVTGLTTADFTVANGTLSGLSSGDGGETWTATFTPTAAVTDTSNLITLDNTGVQDTAGNAGSGSTDSNNYAIDTARPTATIVVADAALAVGETSLVTITFSEAVTDLTTADLTVANGTLSTLSSSDGGVTWTATFTPTAAITDSSNLITLDNTGVQDAAGNAGSGTTDSNNYAIDAVRPTATIVVADASLVVGETSLVTITFSEAVTGLTIADLTAANGTLSGLSSSDGGVTWTATFTPTAAVTDSSNLITLDNTGVQDAAGNAGSGSTESNNYAIDTVRPTSTIVVADASLVVGETSLVTITFSEAVAGLTIADLTAANGTLSGLSSGDGGETWTATFTPTATVTDTSNLITLDNTGVQDAAGNAGSGSTDSNNYAIDNARPTATIVVADTALAMGETSLVTITFSEAVAGLTIADLTAANGTLSGLSSADGGVTWTATFTPTAAVTDSSNRITLDNTGVQDAAGNVGSGTTNSNNYAIDAVRPTATIVVADASLVVGETSLVTITFSEAVAGLTIADLTAANGTLSSLSSSDGGVTWTATFTPTAAVTDTSNLITLDNTGVQDAAGNTGSGSSDSNNYAIDAVRPTATIVVADTALAVGETSLVTITFSEAVAGLTIADLTAANGTLSGLSSSDGGVTWTATFTPTAAVTDTSNLITLDNTGVQDAAGNAGSGSTDSNNYAIDNARPTATIVVADTALAVGETSLVTITFSEAVTGFTIADLTAANGTLSGLSSADGGVTWTATFTPTAAVTDSSNLITLDNTGVQDAAGNAGSGSTDSNNYVIDAVRPTAIIMVADASLVVGETSLVTITFSEAVAGLTIADLTAANGTLSALSSSDGGVTWTATFTPNAAVTDSSNLITLDNTGVQDVAGNAGSGSSDSNNYAIDTARPTATIVMADTALAVGETSLVTIIFSEAVAGLTTADLTVANGTLSALSSGDGGVTWTATFTPNAAVTDTSNLITLDNTGVQDAAGNTGSGSTDSNNYAIDNARPTATIVVADTALAMGETSLVTITFSEAVAGLTTADLTVANGALSALSSGDGGVTWTATFTPTAAITDSSNLITLDNTGVQDAAGNAGSGTTDSNNYAIDAVPLTATIVVADAALTVGETSLVTITFSGAVAGLTIADLTVANGTLSALSSSDGGVTWTATFTPTAAVTDTSNLIALDNTGVQDAAGNAGSGTTDSNNYAIDTARPTSILVVADASLVVGQTSLVTITFSEAVAGLTIADLTVANGTLGSLSSSDGGVTWTATFTPTAAVTDTSNLITLDNTGVQDAAGNAGSSSTDSNNFAIDTVRPTATIVVADTALIAGETSLVTITFSEAVTGWTTADLTVANGTLSVLSSSDGGMTWTATFTPAVAVTDTSSLITLNNSRVQDAAGNAGRGTTESNNYAIDTVRPTATIVMADTALIAGESSLVTITFSEAVNSFTNADLVVSGGTLSAVSSSDGGVTWTATFAPNADMTDAANVITLNNTGVADALGNAGAGSTESASYAIDTKLPTAMLALLGTADAGMGTVTYQLTTSEAVSGIEPADFVLLNTGSVSAEILSVEQIDAQTYRITVANVQGEGTLALSLATAGTGVVDAAGNALAGVTSTARTVNTVPALSQTSEAAVLLPATPPSTTTVVTAPIVLPTVTPPPPDTAAAVSGDSVTLSIDRIVAAPFMPVVPLSGRSDAPREAIDPGVYLVVPSASSYLGVATQRSGAPLQALPDLGVHTVGSEPFSITLPHNTFSVVERSGVQLVVQVRQSNGQLLPGWLRFDARSGTLTGRPPADFSGSLDVEISARDTKGNRASSVLHFDVKSSRPAAGRAGLDAQFKTARHDAQFDARLLRHIDAAAPPRAAPRLNLSRSTH